MDTPLVDETFLFFLRDAKRRLGRAVELAMAYSAFILLLYCRLMCPGGQTRWQWVESPLLWPLIFVPLFLLDGRNFAHASYLHVHRARFAPQNAQHYLVIVVAECLYKVLLCLHLMFPKLRSVLSLKAIMMPYVTGYVVHFMLGHFVPENDVVERAEGCNGVVTFLSELGRFLQFVFVISLSMKVNNVLMIVYDWQTACWSFEGIVVLVVLILLPVCLVSIMRNQTRTVMLSWAVVSGTGLGIVSFLSMYNVATIIDQHCPDPTCKATSSASCRNCRRHLEWALWPWLIYLPLFALGTMLLKSRLATSLHEVLYQAPGIGRVDLVVPALTAGETALPQVMFRITPTYFSRTCNLALLDTDGPSTIMSSQCGNGLLISRESAPSPVQGRSLDISASILSARGATFLDIVESEQLCFICYSNAPDAVILECGHAGMCVSCAEQLPERQPHGRPCPICRAPISRVMRLCTDRPFPTGLFTLSRPSSRGSVHGRSLTSDTTSVPGALDAADRENSGTSSGDSCGGVADRTLGVDAEAHGSASRTGQSIVTQVSGPPWPPAARRHAVVVVPIPQEHGRQNWFWQWRSRLRALLIA